jgi:hypothetical protein
MLGFETLLPQNIVMIVFAIQQIDAKTPEKERKIRF